MSLPRRLALLAWARDARAWVIEDDYDSEFRYGTRPIPCLHGLDIDGRVIYVGSFSKTMFPALRLGFLIVPTDLREVVLAARRAADIHPATMDQAVLADFMTGGHFERTCVACGPSMPRDWRPSHMASHGTARAPYDSVRSPPDCTRLPIRRTSRMGSCSAKRWRAESS